MPDLDAEASFAHDACTIAEEDAAGVLTWLAVCFCGWRSDAYPEEFGADLARLDHPDPHHPASSSGPSGRLRADAAQLLLAGIAADRATLKRGLSEAELGALEEGLGFRFAADQRNLLSRVLPSGEGWPDWRASQDTLRHRLERPGRELEGQVGRGTWWWDSWGPRPPRDVDAIQLAHAQLETVPRLVPVFQDRYMAAMPGPPGSPVFSWYPGDVIVYARDLADYLLQEFGHAERNDGDARAQEVPFWSALVRSDAAPKPITDVEDMSQEALESAVPPTGRGGVFCECCGYTVHASMQEQRAHPQEYLPWACPRCRGKGASDLWRATFDVLERLGRHDAVLTLPPPFSQDLLADVDDVLQRAHQLAREAHTEQVDKAGRDYYEGHLLDVLRRAVAYGADLDEQAAAVLHDIVEDTDVTDQDLLACGFSDKTILMVHLMTKCEGEPDAVYYARLRAYEPARRLKLDADMASNSDPDRLALLEPETRDRLTEKYGKAKALLAPTEN